MLTLIHINDKYDSPTKVPAGQKKALSPTNSSGSEEEEVIMPKVKCHELMSPCLQPQEKVNTGIKSPKRNEKASEKNETVLDYIVKVTENILLRRIQSSLATIILRSSSVYLVFNKKLQRGPGPSPHPPFTQPPSTTPPWNSP